MLDKNIIFNLFSIFLVISAFMVVIVRSPVFSLLFLIASFIFASLILFMLECEFLALLFMVVYVGAIAILFLFAIMMLESKFDDFSKNSIEFMLIKILFYVFLLILILNEINQGIFQNWCDIYSSASLAHCEGLPTEDISSQANELNEDTDPSENKDLLKEENLEVYKNAPKKSTRLEKFGFYFSGILFFGCLIRNIFFK